MMRMLIKQTVSAPTCNQNLVKYSEQIDNAVWAVGSSTVTANQEVDLDGNTTMEKIEYATNASIEFADAGGWVIVEPNTEYTISWDAKNVNMTYCAFGVYDRTNSAWVTEWNNWYSAGLTTLQRISYDVTSPAGCYALGFKLIYGSSAGTIYIGRVQVEENGSCYIETTSTIITP